MIHPILHEIVIPDGTKTIKEDMIRGRDKLTAVHVPNGVTTLDAFSFRYLSELTSIALPDTVTSIGYAAFIGSGLTSFTVGPKVTELGGSIFADCVHLTEFFVDADNPCFTAVDGVVFTKDMTELVCFPAARQGTYTIPYGVTKIRSGAFYGSRLTAVQIPQTVTEIGGEAFRNCPFLKEAHLPDGITEISTLTFFDCPALTHVHIPAFVTEIGCNCFGYCPALTKIELPYGLAKIGEVAFQYCTGLGTLFIPNTVTQIGPRAFLSVDRVIYHGPARPESDAPTWYADRLNDRLHPFLAQQCSGGC